MANHVRRQIRDVAVSLLVGLPTTGARVFKSRVHVMEDGDLPGLIVSTNEEQAEAGSIGSPVVLNRQLNLTVRALAKATVDVDDQLDAMVKEVEAALSGNIAANTFGGLAKSTVLSSVYIDINADAEKSIGQAVMSFNVQYKTQANTPDISI